MAANVAVEQTTAFALAEKAKLVKSLRRFDMVFFTICAFVGLDTLGFDQPETACHMKQQG